MAVSLALACLRAHQLMIVQNESCAQETTAAPLQGWRIGGPGKLQCMRDRLHLFASQLRGQAAQIGCPACPEVQLRQRPSILPFLLHTLRIAKVHSHVRNNILVKDHPGPDVTHASMHRQIVWQVVSHAMQRLSSVQRQIVWQGSLPRNATSGTIRGLNSQYLQV